MELGAKAAEPSATTCTLPAQWKLTDSRSAQPLLCKGQHNGYIAACFSPHEGFEMYIKEFGFKGSHKSCIEMQSRRTANTRRLRGGGQGRKGRGQAWSVGAPTQPPRFLFRLAAEEGRALRLRLPYGRGGNARGHVSPLFEGGRPRGVRSFSYFSREPDSVPESIGRPRAPPPCVSCPGIPIPVASVHCWAQPSGRRGLGLQVIPGGHLPLPHPVDAASSSPPCLLLNRILCSSAYELKMKIIVINVFQKPVTEDGCENTRRTAACVTSR
ncbi:uncharacterized protein LOC128059180 [Budorcas taxicolor]|uniref:uncharacterized protein LOC128059180 n=1 Tax=Budorcas taxicolor TaxID=37181 RepID=UPI00228447C0|nr:uncharacterized protein LOC128059180 [Budorcas taxicolor]